MSENPNHTAAPYLIRVNSKVEYPIDPARIDPERVSLEHVYGCEYLLHYNGKTITLFVEEKDRRNLRLTAEHRKYDILISDHRDQLLARWGLNDSSVGDALEIHAPMPGLVLNIMVEVGQQVESGDPLVVLEAMKMENEIKSLSGGVVSGVHVAAGEPVKKGQLLIEFTSETA